MWWIGLDLIVFVLLSFDFEVCFVFVFVRY